MLVRPFGVGDWRCSTERWGIDRAEVLDDKRVFRFIYPDDEAVLQIVAEVCFRQRDVSWVFLEEIS